MKLLSQIVLFTLLLIFSGCSASKEAIKPKIDENMPIVEKIKTISDVNSMAFEWQPVKEPRAEGYYLYRGVDIGTLKRVAKIDDRFSSHFVDKELKPDTIYYYRFSAYDKDGMESPPSQTVQTRTLKPLESVSYIQAISNLPRKIKLIWRPHSNPRVKSYIIERNDFSTSKWEEIDEVQNRLQAEYIDTKLKDNYTYNYRVKIKTFDEIISLPSEAVKATTKPLLQEAKGVGATTNEANKIVLNWEPIESKELDYYNIYTSDKVDGNFKLYKKVRAKSFEDKIDKAGFIKFYKITAMDKDGLEGLESSAVMGSTLDIPKSPIIKSATIKNGEAIISWMPRDERAKSYIVYKKVKEGWSSSKTYKFINIEDTTFKDRDILPNIEYRYSISAVDANELISKETDEIKLLMPKE